MIESALFSCEWLVENLDAENQLILDATFFLPRQQRNAQDEYLQQHIPGASFFDIDKVADLAHPLPHMLPSADDFENAVSDMGVSNDTQVLIYDNNQFFAAARVWWMFRVFGHDRVQIIDGGFARWKQLKLPITSEPPVTISKSFKARYRPELVFDLKQILDAQASQSRQILDARSADSFLGQRKLAGNALKAGHIPGSINIPYAQLTTSPEQTLLSDRSLNLVFDQAHIDLSLPIVTTCGSGVSACVVALALYQLGLKDIPVYDGSWAEWGRVEHTSK